ncbi:MAG: DUF2188 domain-containing protein [Bacillus sp. (in: firmicutes)]
MPWTKNNYPVSMKNLEECVRNKAIEVANALLEDGYDEGRAIPIAIDTAKEYMSTHHPEGNIYEVKPHDLGWQVLKKGAKRASYVVDTKREAEDKARQLADNQGARVELYRQDGSKQ